MKQIIKLLMGHINKPENYNGNWTEKARDGVLFLKSCFYYGGIILYCSSFPQVLIQSILLPRQTINHHGLQKLGNAQIRCDLSWKIEHSFRQRDIYIQKPLSNSVFSDGEQLVFRRVFEGVDEFDPIIEISQKLIHSLSLFYMEERNAYCQIDKNGDIENVISIFDNKDPDYRKRILVVSIKRLAFETYMMLTEMSLVSRFEFFRGTISNWSKQETKLNSDDHIYCQSGIIPNQASYAFGCLIYDTNLTTEDLIAKFIASEDTSNKEYAEFKVFDLKQCKNITTRCGPENTSNNFQNSNLPYDMSPAFFKAEVLQKYKADSEKYTIKERSISCRNIWDLVTYDINDQGQVSTYLRYLADLPFEEQLYWKSFNEWPKGSISKQAFETDFLGQFPSEENPLQELKKIIESLDRDSPLWWKKRGMDQINAVLIPATDSTKEWADMIQELDKLIVEGFQISQIRSMIKNLGGNYEKDWRSLKLIETYLIKRGLTEIKAECLINPLKELHQLRNIVSAHGAPKDKKKAIFEARKKFGKLRLHFQSLVQNIYIALAGAKDEEVVDSNFNVHNGIIAYLKEESKG